MAKSFKENFKIALVLYFIVVGLVLCAWFFFYEKVPAAKLQPGNHYLTEEAEGRIGETAVRFSKGTVVTEQIRDALIASEGADAPISVTGHGEVVTFDFTMVLQAVNFLLMVYILYGLLWKPILGVLDARSEKIRTDLETARASREEAEKIRSDYGSQMQEAKHERARIVAEGRDAGKEERARIIQDAEKDAERIIERARREGDKEIAEAMEKLKKQIVELSVDIAGRIIQREMTDEDHVKLANALLEEIEQGRHGLG